MKDKDGLPQYHFDKGNDASARIADAIVALLQEDALPSLTSERAKAIARRGGVSQQTLYKKYNLYLWHPRYASFEMLLSE